MTKIQYTATLPLRDIVVFPGMIVPLFVGREKSIKSLNGNVGINSLLIIYLQYMVIIKVISTDLLCC